MSKIILFVFIFCYRNKNEQVCAALLSFVPHGTDLIHFCLHFLQVCTQDVPAGISGLKLSHLPAGTEDLTGIAIAMFPIDALGKKKDSPSKINHK